MTAPTWASWYRPSPEDPLLRRAPFWVRLVFTIDATLMAWLAAGIATETHDGNPWLIVPATIVAMLPVAFVGFLLWQRVSPLVCGAVAAMAGGIGLLAFFFTALSGTGSGEAFLALALVAVSHLAAFGWAWNWCHAEGALHRGKVGAFLMAGWFLCMLTIVGMG